MEWGNTMISYTLKNDRYEAKIPALTFGTG